MLDLVQAHDLAEFELEDGDVQAAREARRTARRHPRDAGGRAGAGRARAGGGGRAGAAAAPVEDGAELAIVKSPIVGTFYRSRRARRAAVRRGRRQR